MKKGNFRFGRFKGSSERGYAQTETLSGEIHSSIRHPQQHGFESSPPAGSETYQVYQDGNPDSGAVLIVAGQAPITLSDGDSVVYSSGGATVHCKGAQIEMNGAAFGGLIKINDLTTKLNLLVAEVNALITAYNSHGHTGKVDPGLTSPTASAATDFDADDYENEDINHG